MEKENSKTESLEVSLEVLDMEEEIIVELPLVFTRPKLPVETAAKQEDIDRWPHLAGVTVHGIEADVGLLIGSDVSEVMEPKEIRPSKNAFLLGLISIRDENCLWLGCEWSPR